MKVVLLLVIILVYILLHFHICKIELLSKFDKFVLIALILGGIAILAYFAPPL